MMNLFYKSDTLAVSKAWQIICLVLSWILKVTGVTGSTWLQGNRFFYCLVSLTPFTMIPKKRNARRFDAQSKGAVYLKRPKPFTKDFDLLTRLQGIRLIYPVLAVHFHLDPVCLVQGSWKQFNSDQDAIKWLSRRCSLTATSAKGAVRFASMEAVMNDYRDSELLSLTLALHHYLTWRRNALSLS